MRIAITVPGELRAPVTKWTAVLGIDRSAFFTRAAEHYVRALEAASLTAQIDVALRVVGDDDSWRRRRPRPRRARGRCRHLVTG